MKHALICSARLCAEYLSYLTNPMLKTEISTTQNQFAAFCLDDFWWVQYNDEGTLDGTTFGPYITREAALEACPGGYANSVEVHSGYLWTVSGPGRSGYNAA